MEFHYVLCFFTNIPQVRFNELYKGADCRWLETYDEQYEC